LNGLQATVEEAATDLEHVVHPLSPIAALVLGPVPVPLVSDRIGAGRL
jgi:hypothetical protein